MKVFPFLALALLSLFFSCEKDPQIITETIIKTDTLIITQVDTVVIQITDTLTLTQLIQDTATNFNRTRQTAQPIAADKSLAVQTYDAFAPGQLTDDVLAQHKQGALKYCI